MIDREALRHAFEVHIRSISPRADFSRAAHNGKYFVESTEYRWLGYCAAMESITRTASPEMPESRIPEGYALVMIEPTLAMSISGQAAIFDNPLVDEGGENCQADHVWRAMIAASPKAQA